MVDADEMGIGILFYKHIISYVLRGQQSITPYYRAIELIGWLFPNDGKIAFR